MPPPERVDDASISSKAGYPAIETDSVGGGAVQGARAALLHTRTWGPVSYLGSDKMTKPIRLMKGDRAMVVKTPDSYAHFFAIGEVVTVMEDEPLDHDLFACENDGLDQSMYRHQLRKLPS